MLVKKLQYIVIPLLLARWLSGVWSSGPIKGKVCKEELTRNEVFFFAHRFSFGGNVFSLLIWVVIIEGSEVCWGEVSSTPFWVADFG